MIVPGTRLPEFKTAACVSTERGKEFKEISSADFAGKWLVLYTYPKDFTFVCLTGCGRTGTTNRSRRRRAARGLPPPRGSA
jgi:lipoyl-dependent peroxiredoxin subunit C